MDEDAFEVTANYAHVDKLNINMEEYQEEGGMNMCKAILEMIEDGRNEGYESGRADGRSEGYESGRADGRSEGISEGELIGKIKVYSLELNLTPEEIAGKLGVDKNTVEQYL
jgi:flagellar biosynthesis/type III secretory pathway protein FliH